MKNYIQKIIDAVNMGLTLCQIGSDIINDVELSSEEKTFLTDLANAQ